MALPSEVLFNPFELVINELAAIKAEISALKTIQETPKRESFLSAKEVCVLLKISTPTRIALAKSGRLIPMRVGRKLLYSERSVNEALKSYSKWDRI